MARESSSFPVNEPRADMLKSLVPLLPMPARKLYRSTHRWWQRRAYLGEGRVCPVCGRACRRFMPYGRVVRPEAMCPHCDSLERHRLLWVFYGARPHLFRGGTLRMLHVAPEACMERRLAATAGPGYVSADLLRSDVMARIDLCAIDRPDGSFDAIQCSHVLEHVHDDRCAMRELHRVLSDDGWAVLMVPMHPGETMEDPSIVTPAGRLAAFGQEDHVRRYGEDFLDRLRAVGFRVEVVDKHALLDGDAIVRAGLSYSDHLIFYCTRASAGCSLADAGAPTHV